MKETNSSEARTAKGTSSTYNRAKERASEQTSSEKQKEMKKNKNENENR